MPLVLLTCAVDIYLEMHHILKRIYQITYPKPTDRSLRLNLTRFDLYIFYRGSTDMIDDLSAGTVASPHERRETAYCINHAF